MVQRSRLLLRRRGTIHGRFLASGVSLYTDQRGRSAGSTRFATSEAIHLSGLLCRRIQTFAESISRTMEMLRAVRRGGGLLEFVREQLAHQEDFRLSGVVSECGDDREIEKVFTTFHEHGRLKARDLYAKLSWVSTDDTDESLRVRFAYGSESLKPWRTSFSRAPFSDRLARTVFPECEVIDGDKTLRRLLLAWTRCDTRWSDRIVYSNAPGGGAAFHDDDEPRQIGVLYSQLAGETAWLALPKQKLAEILLQPQFQKSWWKLRSTPELKDALSVLDDHTRPAIDYLMNATPDFTSAVVSAGGLFHMRTGDVLILPSPTPGNTCWHSVFALGKTPSLAHSYGLFRAGS